MQRGSETHPTPRECILWKTNGEMGIILGLGETLTTAFHRLSLPSNSPRLLNWSPVRNLSAVFYSFRPSSSAVSPHGLAVLRSKRLRWVLSFLRAGTTLVHLILVWRLGMDLQWHPERASQPPVSLHPSTCRPHCCPRISLTGTSDHAVAASVVFMGSLSLLDQTVNSFIWSIGPLVIWPDSKWSLSPAFRVQQSCRTWTFRVKSTCLTCPGL